MSETQSAEVQTGPTEESRSYLGASDIAAVLGIAPYRTALDVWAEKVHGIGVTDNEPMRIGRELERPLERQNVKRLALA